MTTVTLTDFRSHASGMLTRVEHGETLVVLRPRASYCRSIACHKAEQRATFVETTSSALVNKGRWAFFGHS